MVFPDSYPNLLSPDFTMAAALTAAQAATAVAFPTAGVHLNAAISIAAVDDDMAASFSYAGFRDTGMYFSASLLKVAALLAAYELRQSAADFASDQSDCTAGTMFTGLRNEFDQDIQDSVPLLLNTPGITPNMRVPKYPTVFAAGQPLPDGGCGLSFNPAFAADVRGMIVDSDNDQASATIQALGYSWINGLMSNGGLFNQSTNTGIWLGGTFTGAFPAVRVPSINDGPSAQATTTIDMAKFLALLLEGRTLDARSADGISVEMLGLLADAQSLGDSSWMTVGARASMGLNAIGPGFTITHCKLGVGDLTAGPEVASEATILNHDGTGRQFIVAWQNVTNTATPQNAISFLVGRTILNYLGLP
jgi:hypothetical protein